MPMHCVPPSPHTHGSDGGAIYWNLPGAVVDVQHQQTLTVTLPYLHRCDTSTIWHLTNTMNSAANSLLHLFTFLKSCWFCCFFSGSGTDTGLAGLVSSAIRHKTGNSSPFNSIRILQCECLLLGTEGFKENILLCFTSRWRYILVTTFHQKHVATRCNMT